MTTDQKIVALRKEMSRVGVDAWVVPSSDPHNSEYSHPRFGGRRWLSGFTGSVGTVVVTQDRTLLWVDGRYHIQAAQEIEGSQIELMKQGMPGVLTWQEWVASDLSEGQILGCFGETLMTNLSDDLQKRLQKKGANLRVCEEDLLAEIWQDRPAAPQGPAFLHDIKWAGKTSADKLEQVRKAMHDNECQLLVVSDLCDVAWLLNLRGSDIRTCPVATAFAMVTPTGGTLFIDDVKCPEEVSRAVTEAGLERASYTETYRAAAEVGELKAWIHAPATNARLSQALVRGGAVLHDAPIPTTLARGIKNDTEVAGFRAACEQDGVAMVRFLHWLDAHVASGITEGECQRQCEKFRQAGEHFYDISFTSIPAYGANGAMTHYSTQGGEGATLQPDGFFLFDSGGNYHSGTTDLTRTVACGGLTTQQKKHYSMVLKGMIRLSRAVFLQGACGEHLDVLARGVMWDEYMNYRHGTGHGVGMFLNVHEGPHGISPRNSGVAFEPGMIVSNEPGIYLEGRYGIRIENLLLTKELCVNEEGTFLGFEPLTLCPIDLRPVDTSVLNADEIAYLNNYHRLVRERLAPHFNAPEDAEVLAWLIDATRDVESVC